MITFDTLKDSDEDVFFNWFKSYAELHLEWWRKSFGTNSPMKKGFVEEQWKLLQKSSLDPDYFVLVARINNEPVGLVWAKVKSDDWFDCLMGQLHWIFVDPKYVKQGIATKLMNEVQYWFEKREVKGRILYVSNHNSEAIKLYQKFGFEIVDYRMLGSGYDTDR